MTKGDQKIGWFMLGVFTEVAIVLVFRLAFGTPEGRERTRWREWMCQRDEARLVADTLCVGDAPLTPTSGLVKSASPVWRVEGPKPK